MKNEYQCVVPHSRAESPNLKYYRDDWEDQHLWSVWIEGEGGGVE